tara:strand:- start:317 stop:589 length:273 start_codon:yes stop_codon:yes gene_type:complete
MLDRVKGDELYGYLEGLYLAEGEYAELEVTYEVGLVELAAYCFIRPVHVCMPDMDIIPEGIQVVGMSLEGIHAGWLRLTEVYKIRVRRRA